MISVIYEKVCAFFKDHSFQKFYNISCGIGTLIVAISGFYLSTQFNITKDKEIEIMQTIIQDKRNIFEETSNLLNTRLFDFNRLLWVIDDIKTNKDITEEIKSKINDKEKIYYDSIRQFNIDMHKISNQLQYIFDKEIAELFSIQNDSNVSPKGIFGKFIKLHNDTLYIINCISNKKDIPYREKIDALDKQKYDISNHVFLILDIMAKKTFEKSNMIKNLIDEE
ncbi:hypothetical protein [Desulfovibrio sp. ZJ200]|uniref:hypothetical protein n=1 Tax=Desulfovibrio sp. ZJ200 TaxID=2709792 RepID=UPI0013EE1A55|nr:hypothetical protein [Desulfovibrio sp. ZJ200]